MNKVRILPYRQGSKSAKALAEALGGRVLKLEGSKFKPKVGDTIINWGYAQEGYPFGPAGFINDPSDIKSASNKLNFFHKATSTTRGLLQTMDTHLLVI